MFRHLKIYFATKWYIITARKKLSYFITKIIEVKKKKHIKVSKTDPESGNYHKGEHEKCFAYSHQAFSDKNGYVVGCSTNAGNMHDSVAFDEAYDELIEEHGEKIKNVCLDAGYNTPAICKKIKDSGKTAYMPYVRPKGQTNEIKKKEFKYNKEEDIYVCPTGCILTLSTINKEGYKIYKSNRSLFTSIIRSIPSNWCRRQN